MTAIAELRAQFVGMGSGGQLPGGAIISPAQLVSLGNPVGDAIAGRLPAIVPGPRLLGETNDGPRVRRAIAVAQILGIKAVRIEDGTTLTMGAGSYGTIGADPNLKAALLVPDDIAILSNGSKLMLLGTNRDSYCSGIVAKGFGLKVRGITVDYVNRPYFQGFCSGKDATGATFDIDTSVSIPTFADIQQLAQYEPQLKRWFAAILDVPADTRSGYAITKVSEGRYRVDFTGQSAALALVQTGQFYVAKHQVFGQYGFYAEDGDRLNLDDSTVNCSAGMGVGYSRLKSVDIGERFRIEAPGSGAMSCMADGIHGHNIQQHFSIRAARLANTGDDPINVNSTGNFVFRANETSKPPNTFLLGGRLPARIPDVGESLTAISPAGQAASLGRILTIDRTGGYASTPALTMSQPLPAGFVGTADNGGNLNAAWSVYNDLDCGPMTITPALVENCRGTVRLRGRSVYARYFARNLVGYACYASTIFALDAEGPFPQTMSIDIKADNAPYTSAGALGAIAIIAGPSDGVTIVPNGTIKDISVHAVISNTPVGALWTQGVSGLNADITVFNTNFAPWAGTPHGGNDFICINSSGRVKMTKTDGSQAGTYYLENSFISVDAYGYTATGQAPAAYPVWVGSVKPTVPAASTDAASTQSLVNSIRSALISYGMIK